MSSLVLVTGAFGYIGGRIVHSLSQAGFRVRAASSRNFDKLDTAWLPENVDVINLDVLSETKTSDALKGVDTIVHLSAVNEIESGADPLGALQVNALGTLRLLESAIEMNIKRFIFFSTAHIYASPLEGRIDELTVPRPAHPYSISHLAAEYFVLAAHKSKKIEGIVVRLSNGFGAPAHAKVNRWTLLVNDLCRQAVTNRKLVLKSDGRQLRDFITLSDVCRASLHFLTLPINTCGDGLFNLGGENTVSILEMTKLIAFRCEAVLGFLPEIEVAKSTGESSISSLDYNIDKLKGTGFNLVGRVTDEIDSTLLLCRDMKW